jgi:hypothetical protein
VQFTKPGERAGPTCFSGTHETRTYGGPCDPGFHRIDPIGLFITDKCDVCTAAALWASSNTSNCTVNIRFDTPGDCLKSITVNLVVSEIQNTGPPPTGCP